MKIPWDELEDLLPTLSCYFHIACICSLSISVKNYKNMEYIICFLKGLYPNYTNVRTQILLMDPIPSVSKVYSLVSQKDTQPYEKSIESITFSVNINPPKYSQ